MKFYMYLTYNMLFNTKLKITYSTDPDILTNTAI